MKLGTMVAVLLLAAGTVLEAPAQILTTITTLDGSAGEPAYMSMVQGADGNFYGTTVGGGVLNNWGTVFEVSAKGALTILHRFCSQPNCTDGGYPQGGLLLGGDDNFYGVTSRGGNTQCYPNDGGCGTIFRISSAGVLTTLYTFCSQAQCNEGAWPAGGLIEGVDGNLYGTTSIGGDLSCTVEAGGCGTIFRLTKAGALTTLHKFEGDDGFAPSSTLVQGVGGYIYGTTVITAFKMTPKGYLTTLHTFCSGNCTEGSLPNGLMQASDKNFYGTTQNNGQGGGGALYRLTSTGEVTTISALDPRDGQNPMVPLIQATDGNLYSSAWGGGIEGGGCGEVGCGTLFNATLSGSVGLLHEFDGSDGENPSGGLLQSTSGLLFGTTSSTIFSLDMGLGPFVAFRLPYGKVGQTGGILGQGFTGTTSVSLNGIPASFTVVSDTFIRATVPPGATTGYVTVVTPSGTLTSNVPFHVLK